MKLFYKQGGPVKRLFKQGGTVKRLLGIKAMKSALFHKVSSGNIE